MDNFLIKLKKLFKESGATIANRNGFLVVRVGSESITASGGLDKNSIDGMILANSKPLPYSLDLLQRDSHVFGHRGCKTCKKISQDFGQPFGCYLNNDLPWKSETN